MHWDAVRKKILLICLLFTIAFQGNAQNNPIDFESDIQPVFLKNCIICHGPSMQKSGFRLDRKQDAFESGKSKRAIVPGDAENSLLFQMIDGQVKDKLMPFGGKKLPQDQIDAIRDWIDQGAHWPDNADLSEDNSKSLQHWSFQPIEKPGIPKVQNQDWVKKPIDAFVLAHLESKDIAPSPQADKEILIRRLYLDLIGLPPTVKAVEAFMNDTSSDAYESLVDELLASPHFGERWGRHWLDLARYADSDGYEKDNPRPYAYRYRDWVIDAVNKDMPFDRFTVEQIAGDLLPHPTLKQLTATGFNRNTLTNTEGGVDQEEFRVLAVKDRVNTLGSAWLGLTIGCAECHDHKFDPLSQKEYYGMYAFFNEADEKNVKAPKEDDLKEYNRAKTKYDLVQNNLQKALDLYTDLEMASHLAEWESKRKRNHAEWKPLKPLSAGSIFGTTFSIEPDGTVLAGGPAPEEEHYTLTTSVKLKKLSGLRLEVYPTESGKSPGPGRASHGNFVVSEIRAYIQDGDRGRLTRIPFKRATADYSQSGYAIGDAIDGDLDTGWAIANRQGQIHIAVLEATQAIDLPTSAKLIVEIDQRYGSQHTLGSFRLFATGSDGSIEADSVPYQVAQLLDTPSGERTRPQKRELLAFYRDRDPVYRELQQALDTHRKKEPPYPPGFVMAFEPAEEERENHIMERGNFMRPGEQVDFLTPHVLHAFHPRNGKPDRLDLARWLMAKENPLTARVAANRVWQHLFGKGLVASVDDFGTRGDLPTHPKLLDWLAVAYRELGWSRKALIKTIVMSSTYRQSSHTRPELHETDPTNQWLARQNRFRVESEIVRDLSLKVSGLLSSHIGGPSIKPPLPSDIAALGYANSVKWKESQGEAKFRRGMYIFFQRTVPYPMLTTFDSPESTITCTRRERSNTPLQALAILNDQVFVECAQHFGANVAGQNGMGLEDRIRLAFQTCLSREPNADELATLSHLYIDCLQIYRNDAEAAKTLVGDIAVENTDMAETAAWIAVSRTLMNLEEFFTRE